MSRARTIEPTCGGELVAWLLGLSFAMVESIDSWNSADYSILLEQDWNQEYSTSQKLKGLTNGGTKSFTVVVRNERHNKQKSELSTMAMPRNWMLT